MGNHYPEDMQPWALEMDQKAGYQSFQLTHRSKIASKLWAKLEQIARHALSSKAGEDSHSSNERARARDSDIPTPSSSSSMRRMGGGFLPKLGWMWYRQSRPACGARSAQHQGLGVGRMLRYQVPRCPGPGMALWKQEALSLRAGRIQYLMFCLR